MNELISMIIIAIETSCDETSIAILENKKVLSNITVSQILEQQKYGGVMPSLAAKLHVKNIQRVLLQSLKEAKVSPEKINYIAYTEKPGLIICLQIGKTVAETLSLYLNKPLIPCNHLEGHVYASLLEKNEEWEFPALALIISGGHTQIYQLNNHLDFVLLGETCDDAIGECLDKSAILLGHNYPGGPIIEELALSGKNTYKLPLPKNDKSCDFSFSGLKSEISRLVSKEGKNININNLACSLQHTLVEILTKKLKNAWLIKKSKTIIVGGGVIANKFLRNCLIKNIQKWDREIKVFIPKKKYSTDNAAMIGILAYYKIVQRTRLESSY
ncbi:tRNA (adenosine(37)-N6)-threonylcarbamoyltransferase complex transferase subunit TsaD [endosymbiont GvMRE of Glomus versiforme]|uniref:tRNA (adenosine(37)-N6)-threonylcarbamoyltransferase complex transferase subunit TsaD n=1 Tax=endosymbiont GvMRE of Glomus versiforme TaxID=2039283 RepID=UPI000EC1BBED|nr:tRNA (adenosine(37)-N6)-threonylcarbamoyltransferase complex transferase subunit TsaD [endosymbiont GvMRE of Glomus versiforme]RHZ35363.1 tRNA N6-adenosine threonylcarbamoyltransferase [endosymbiont GvMRE of Glomus versiforme]